MPSPDIGHIKLSHYNENLTLKDNYPKEKYSKAEIIKNIKRILKLSRRVPGLENIFLQARSENMQKR